MVHVHGAQAQQLAQATPGVDPAELVAVPVDVAKHAAMALVCDFTGELLARPLEFPMTMAGVRLLVERVQAATRGRMIRLVRVGVEAARHYHQPLVSAGSRLRNGSSSGSTRPRWPANGSSRDGDGSRPMRWIWWRSATCCGPGTALVIASWPRRWASWLGGWPTGSGG